MLEAQPARRLVVAVSRSAKNGCSGRYCAMVCMAVTSILTGRLRPTAERGGLGGDVDGGGAPGDAPAAADAPGRAELVDPGAELVRHPLPVAGFRRIPHRPAVDVGEIGVEAGVPHPVPFGDLAGEVRDVVHGGAAAGRADHRAVGAGLAPGRDVIPAGTLHTRVQQLLSLIHISEPTR